MYFTFLFRVLFDPAFGCYTAIDVCVRVCVCVCVSCRPRLVVSQCLCHGKAFSCTSSCHRSM